MVEEEEGVGAGIRILVTEEAVVVRIFYYLPGTSNSTCDNKQLSHNKRFPTM